MGSKTKHKQRVANRLDRKVRKCINSIYALSKIERVSHNSLRPAPGQTAQETIDMWADVTSRLATKHLQLMHSYPGRFHCLPDHANLMRLTQDELFLRKIGVT